MKKNFGQVAPRTAVDIVMAALLNGDDAAKTPIEKAITEGLAGRFSFIVCQDESGFGLFADIYPTGQDVTFKCPDYIRAMLPEAEGIDECCETIWNFPADIDTPAKMAQLLVKRGFVWDKNFQEDVQSKEIFDEIKSALESMPNTKAAPPVKKKGPK
ncbi:MAG: hypothetical protein HY052_09620 [Proteobacteria bacterium]|nr:hypothetical protein [Pseudomonadota bacterium]